MNFPDVLFCPGKKVKDRLQEAESLLSTEDYQAVIEMRHRESGSEEARKVRADSTQAYEPGQILLTIRFAPRARKVHRMDVLLQALQDAAIGKEFVSLKWFRDKYLGHREQTAGWTESERFQLLNQAIAEGLVVRGTVSNPDPAKPHTTTIALNYSHPEVRSALSDTSPRGLFRPIGILGESLSQTIVDSRR